MRCSLVRLAICFVALIGAIGVSTPASAQPDSGTIFFTVGAFANVERTSHGSSFGNDPSDLNGSVPGGALGLGVYLTPNLSARVEWAMTGWLDYDTELYAYPLIAGVGGGAPNVGGVSPRTGGIGTRLVAPRFEGKRMSKAGFALLGYRVGPERAAVELLGGMGWVAQSTRSSYDFRIALPANTVIGLPYPYSESHTVSYDAVGVVGVDATVALTDHAAVVPQFRTYVSNGVLSMRPGLSFRWTF